LGIPDFARLGARDRSWSFPRGMGVVALGGLVLHAREKEEVEMPILKNRTATVGAALVVTLGAMSLSGCATRSYVDEQIAAVNGRISAVDAKANDALARADAANAAAQAAATDARTANQRIDQLGGRVDQLEARPVRAPRG
jgi:outer membrane murein-binding lipoprotein Lpp